MTVRKQMIIFCNEVKGLWRSLRHKGKSFGFFKEKMKASPQTSAIKIAYST
jgi:hypothetical protein